MLDRIRRRLTMGYMGILALILILFGTVVVAVFWTQLLDQQDRQLRQRVESKRISLSNGGETPGLVPAIETEIALAVIPFESPVSSETSPDDAGTPIELLPRRSASYYLGLPSADYAVEAARKGKPTAHTVPGSEDYIRIVSVPIADDSGETVGVIQAARSLQEVYNTVRNLVFVLALVGLGALFMSVIGGLYISRRAMRPVQDTFDRQRAFVANASHELKTPLTLMRADAEVLHRSLPDSGDRELVEDLLGETDQMNAVLSDLLLLARLDAGKLSVATEPFNLAAVVSETAERFGARAGTKEVRLEVINTGKVPARGDPDRTGQILAALLDNALRFTPPGGAVELTTHTQNGRVVATVQDTGSGIPREHLSRVFDRFYRADAQSAARTRDGGGTGLGLAISRDLARAQGGDLTANNAKTGGACFTLGLPAAP